MRQIWSIATKELRGYFNSAVAIIFLATFLGVVLVTFFSVDKFFARNAADVAPLFQWLPFLLIFLVAALTMRLWSEEQKTGTIEILLTLPVPIHRLVVGKFLAGLLLVAVALALTLGLPITVSMMGNLDWGPVIGGYVAALLLASAYLAIGLCISSTTENQIVALIGTAVVCLLFYVPGTEFMANLFGVDGAELLRLIGTGSRFESIARGVLDLRDLAYYAALVALFLTLNTVLLEAKRWSQSARTRPMRTNASMGVALVALNALALNLWLQPVTAARVDLTEDSTYSLSAPTERLLASLDEPLILRGYFSDKTHPLLVPLVPQLRNMLLEYKIEGGGKVRVEIVDPSKDEELEAEAFERYGIRPTPFQFAGRHEQSIVNAYFNVLVAYGDQHVVLGVADLIQVAVLDINNVQAYLDNVEYQITKSIRKVVYGFQNVDALFATLPGTIELHAYITPEALPEQWMEVPAQIDAIAQELESQSGGKLTYQRMSPTTEAEQMALFEEFGIRPFSRSLFSNEVFYLHLFLKRGNRMEAVSLPESPNETTLRQAIRTGIERVAPGITKVVGLVTPPPKVENPPMPGMQAPPPQEVQSFRTLRQALSEGYEVRSLSLDSGTVPDDVDVLLLAGPEKTSPEAHKAIDQFLMRGGAVVVLAGRYRLDMEAARTMGVALERVDPGLDELLANYGVEIPDRLVLDEKNAAFPMPQIRNIGGARLQVIEPLSYPFFVQIGSEGMKQGGILTGGLGTVIMHWATPVAVKDAAPGEAGDSQPRRRVDTLMMSSDKAWLQSGTNVQPDFDRYRETGFGPPESIAEGEQAPHVLAVAISGMFDSAFRNQAGQRQGAPSGGPEGGDDALPERLIERSTPDARLVVIGSSSFVSDTALAISEQAGTRDVINNLKLVQNAVDWAVEDTDMLSIRSRGSAARTLTGVSESERRTWEIVNYVIALLGLGLVVVVARVRRQAGLRAASRLILPAQAGSRSAQPEDESTDKEDA
jgi:ABC-2 type transport system permease protein